MRISDWSSDVCSSDLGYPVIIAGRSGDKLQATAELLEAEGIRIEAVSGDVAKSDDVQRFVAAAEELAPLAIAVHNAGSNRPAPFLEQAGDEFEVHWREHALGGFNLARAALPALLSRQNGRESCRARVCQSV